MSMRTLEELRDKFCKELDEIARKDDLNAGDLETVHKLTDTIKNIDKIYMLEDEGYSGAGEWEAMGRFGDNYNSRHDGGSSYEKGRKRDSMGRYSRDGRRNNGRYSREDSKEHMISKLEDMMEDAENERVKSAIRKCISELERD